MQPLLVKFSVPPTPTAAPPITEVRRETGLIHRVGSDTPIIEEILDATCQWNAVTDVGSLLTEAGKDQPDPDLIRQYGIMSAMATYQTRAGDDTPDPDYIRCMISQLLAEMSSTMTKAEPDEPDPDLVRRSNDSSIQFGE